MPYVIAAINWWRVGAIAVVAAILVFIEVLIRVGEGSRLFRR